MQISSYYNSRVVIHDCRALKRLDVCELRCRRIRQDVDVIFSGQIRRDFVLLWPADRRPDLQLSP